ncbi:hypothetical protein QAD02_020840 [Eretmocerus hayati]|uniref:Uncharacterized protein n=1 Tax=Eretmocerus hayati TaxID=131215 RepID=A0ACC2PRR5_9HYME|nr:hypothetical protein QAD02_020840 [Eretmocerus hayati]
MRRFMIIFLVAMEDHIKNEEDPVWKIILVLRDVCCYSNAPAYSDEQLCVFQDLIYEYVELRHAIVELFRTVPLLRKHGFLVHLVEKIRHFGPMEFYCTRRFESKHKYFKRIIAILQNFKNVPLLLSKEHELYQCSLTNQYVSLAEAQKLFGYKQEECFRKFSMIIDNFSQNNNAIIKFLASNVVFRGTMIGLKVWSCERSVKRAVIILGDLTAKTALEEASKKLGHQVQQLRVKSNGTLIDDDMVLQYFKDQVILLLKDEEEWSPPIAKIPNAHSTFINSSRASPTLSENSPSFSLISCNSDKASQKKRTPLSDIDPNPKNEKPKQQPEEGAETSHDSYKIPFDHLQQDARSRINAVKNHSVVLRRKEYCIIKKVCLNFVVGEMRFINASLREPSSERVAKKLRDWHPTFFEDRCNGKREGSGIAATIRIMRDHNDFLDRLKSEGDKKEALTIPISGKNKIPEELNGNTSGEEGDDEDSEYENGIQCYLEIEDKRVFLNF